MAQETVQAPARSAAVQTERPAFWEHRRPRHLLTGKAVCGVCGWLFAGAGGDYLACRAAGQGSCTNPVRPLRHRLEAHVLDVLGRQLMPTG